MDRKIPVYVRKGATDRERIFSFPLPSVTLQKDLLERGLAIDGNQVLFHLRCVSNTSHPNEVLFLAPMLDEHLGFTSLPNAIANIEQNLVKYLEQHGYEVEFV